jgi:hypothetical protein
MRKTTITLAGIMLAISTSASTQGTQCLPCPAGTYAAAGATNCTPCPAGRYCPSGVASPQTCPAGHVPDSTQSSCTVCKIGTYATAGMASCTPCPAGKYQPNITASSCITCPSGTFSAAAGTSSCTTCKTYTSGKIPGDDGYFNYDGSYIYCTTSGATSTTGATACVLDSSQSGGGCGNYNSVYNCSDASSRGTNLRGAASRFCANGGSF